MGIESFQGSLINDDSQTDKNINENKYKKIFDAIEAKEKKSIDNSINGNKKELGVLSSTLSGNNETVNVFKKNIITEFIEKANGESGLSWIGNLNNLENGGLANKTEDGTIEYLLNKGELSYTLTISNQENFELEIMDSRDGFNNLTITSTAGKLLVNENLLSELGDEEKKTVEKYMKTTEEDINNTHIL